MQGAQKLRNEAHLQVRHNDEVEAQRSKWNFYDTIKVSDFGFLSGARHNKWHQRRLRFR